MIQGSIQAAQGATPLRVALVDDEPPALRRLQMAIDKAPGAEVVGTASNGEEALKLIARGGIDVVLLDIRMPGLSGLDLARAIDPERAPAFIFVTVNLLGSVLFLIGIAAVYHTTGFLDMVRIREQMPLVEENLEFVRARNGDPALTTLLERIVRRRRRKEGLRALILNSPLQGALPVIVDARRRVHDFRTGRKGNPR